jgi:hypothetical protein
MKDLREFADRLRRMRRPIAAGCRPLAALGAVAITLVASSAAADPRCTVTLRSTLDDASSWRGAVTSAEREIAKHPPAGNDCREVLVDADERGAEVTFTTRDDRTATRRIARPRDLRPVIEALLVTVPEASAPPTSAAMADEPVVAAVPEVEPVELEGQGTPTSRDRARANVEEQAGPIVALGAGMTIGAGEAGTVGQVEVGYLTRGWELALVGRLEPSHEAPKTSAHASLSAAGMNVLAARRAMLGPVTLLYGGTFGVFSVSEEARKDTSVTGEHRHEDELVDARVGAMLGCLAPRIGRIRFRGQVDAQFGLLELTPRYADLPTNPRFTLAFTLGAETNLLP